jgi:hypothetical protein
VNAPLGGEGSAFGLIGGRRLKFAVLQLRAVHIFIGDLQQCVRIVAIGGIYADSKAGSDPQLAAAV